MTEKRSETTNHPPAPALKRRGSNDSTETKKTRPTALYIGGIVAVLIAIGIALALSLGKGTELAKEKHDRSAEMAAGPHIQTATITASPAQKELTLQGEARAYASVTLYAKVSGYLKTILADKGDKVREGQTIATIESPETDRAYLAALADANNKKKQADRDAQLLKQQLVSPQQSEQSEAAAEIASQQLESLRTQKSYELITAPFAGTVTARYADRGALLQNAANSQTSALPVVTVSQVNRLRIDVYLDQRYAGSVHNGDPVTITMPERPGFSLNARVSRFTGQLDPKTRMLLVEIEVPNTDGKIIAGSTVAVSLKIARPAMMEVPSSAIVVRKNKYFVPVIDQSDHLNFKEVQVGENNGQTIQILSGLRGNEQIGVNVGDAVSEGAHVQPAPIAPPTAASKP